MHTETALACALRSLLVQLEAMLKLKIRDAVALARRVEIERAQSAGPPPESPVAPS